MAETNMNASKPYTKEGLPTTHTRKDFPTNTPSVVLSGFALPILLTRADLLFMFKSLKGSSECVFYAERILPNCDILCLSHGLAVTPLKTISEVQDEG